MQLTIKINNESFYINSDENIEYVYITHPQWSLVGAGKDVVEALNSLLKEARDLAEADERRRY